MKKKCFSVLLAMVLAVTALAGCGGSKDSGGDQQGCGEHL